MKVVAFNGSPNRYGNTHTAIKMVTDELEDQGIETEIIHIGKKAIKGCTGCGHCFKLKNETCIFTEDKVNEWIQKMKLADGIILGSPVHWSGISGTMKSFLDRAFYVTGAANPGMLRHKVGVSVAAVRRSGGLPAIQQLNNYILYSEMIMPSSNYWNVIHGAKPEEVNEDIEGTQIMRVLGKNMAWTMKIIEHGKSVIPPPEMEKKSYMNFIRE